MGKHLNTERWFYINKAGTLTRKRVTKKLNEQFPLEFRLVWQKHGSAKLVKYLMCFYDISLAEAWRKTKHMFND